MSQRHAGVLQYYREDVRDELGAVPALLGAQLVLRTDVLPAPASLGAHAIMTVNVVGEVSQGKMVRWVERWEAERKKRGEVEIVNYRAPDPLLPVLRLPVWFPAKQWSCSEKTRGVLQADICAYVPTVTKHIMLSEK